MKIAVKKEFDGKYYIAYCENIPGCYVQSTDQNDLMIKLRAALDLYIKYCEDRCQPIPNEYDHPVLDIRIRFNILSSDQLVKIFEKYNYHKEYIDHDSILLLNSEFPFNRIHLPQVNNLSPLIIQKVFGVGNTIYVSRKNMKINASVS